MSRIGKKPVLVPAGIDVAIDSGTVTVKGAKETLTVAMPPHTRVSLSADPRALVVEVEDPENVAQRALWGLARQLLNNAVTGLQKPYERSLEFVGVGFKVALEGRKLVMDVGYSHKVTFVLPEGVDASVDKQIVTLKSSNKYLLGETAARVRRVKPPEPYKGKGIKYTDEVIRRKAGKTAKTSG